MSKTPTGIHVAPAPFNPSDLISIQELARRLRSDVPLEKGVQWVREKIRRRTPNPIPCVNMGRALIFSWSAVSEWLRNCPRPVHAVHPPRRKKQLRKVA